MIPAQEEIVPGLQKVTAEVVLLIALFAFGAYLGVFP